MRTITFAIQKGGTGKTSLSVTTAIEMANRGKKVLLVDADPQGNSTTWTYMDPIKHEFCEVLRDKCDIKNAIVETKFKNLYLLPTAGLDGELKDYSDNASGIKLAKIKLLLTSVADNFDYCIIDTSPNFGNFEQSIFYASNEIVTVLLLDNFSKDGLQIFTNRLRKFKSELDPSVPKPNFNKIILNAKTNVLAQHKALFAMYKKLEDKGYKVYSVPQDQAFRLAQTNNISVQELTNKAETKESIALIANDLMGVK